ncbi:MAG: methyltransferase domain-containing protein [Bacteroidota bacterium]
MENNETECLLCRGTAKLKHNKYPGYQEPLTYKIYHCHTCNTGFSLPMDDSTVIYENIYKNGDKVPGYNRYWRYAKNIKKISQPLDYLARNDDDYWSVKKALEMFVKDKTSTKILEIGSGLGYLTYSLIKADYKVIGLDVSQTAVTLAANTFGDHFICKDLFEYAESHPESYDIVILTEVIEHVNKPLDFIDSIIRLLKPGGRAIITTPNKSFYPLEVVWASDLPPVHCWWLGEESMNFIAEKLNIGISFINFREYFKMNYRVIGIRSLNDNNLPKPFFNKNGELIKHAASKGDLKFSLQLLLIKFHYLNKAAGKLQEYTKRIYGKSRKLLSPNVIVCKDRGNKLCAIMLKPLRNYNNE